MKTDVELNKRAREYSKLEAGDFIEQDGQLFLVVLDSTYLPRYLLVDVSTGLFTEHWPVFPAIDVELGGRVKLQNVKITY